MVLLDYLFKISRKDSKRPRELSYEFEKMCESHNPNYNNPLVFETKYAEMVSQKT